MQTKKCLSNHEITEKSGGFSFNFVKILPNYRLNVILKLITQSEMTKIRLIWDIPAQWAKIRQGLDIFRISSKCVCLSNGEV